MTSKLQQFDKIEDFLYKIFNYNSDILNTLENNFKDIFKQDIVDIDIKSNNCYNLDLIK